MAVDFARQELEGWMGDLVNAIADEADRLVRHDTEIFQSRIAFLAPAPNANTPMDATKTQDS